MTKKLLRFIGYSLAIAVVGTALFASGMRAVSPFVGHYRVNVERFAAEVVQQPLHIEDMELGWSWFQPVVQLSDVSIYDKKQTHTLLHLRRLTIGIDLWSSLIHWQWKPALLRAEGGDITLRQQKDGSILLEGFNSHRFNDNQQSVQTDLRDVLPWLLADGKFSFEQFTIHWFGRDGTLIPIQNLQMSIVNSGQVHHIQGSASLAQTIASQVNFKAKFLGELSDMKDWHGDGQVVIRDMLLAQWLTSFNVANLQINNGLLNGKLKFNVRDSQLAEVNTQFALKDLNIIQPHTKRSQLMQLISAELQWLRYKEGWQLTADNVQLRHNGESWRTNKISWQVANRINGLQKHKLYIQYLRLQDISTWLIWDSLLPAEWKLALNKLQPQGELGEIYWQGTPNQQADHHDWYGYAAFNQASWAEWKNIPGVSGLTGQIYLWPEMGRLEINNEDTVVMRASPLFNKALSFDELAGSIDWRWTTDKWQIALHNAAIKNKHFSLEGNSVVQLGDKVAETTVDLTANLKIHDVSQIKRYLPNKGMSPVLHKWLQQAFVRGQDVQSNIKVQGKLADFPFANNKGIFTVDSELNDVDFRYDPDWPIIKKGHATVQFKQGDLSVHIRSATLTGTPIQNVDVTVPQIGNDNEILYLKGQVKGDSSQALYFVKQTPLRESLPAITDVSLKGPIKLQLDLAIPLDTNPQHKTRVNGHIDLADNSLSSQRLSIDDLKGELIFSERDLASKNLKGQLFGTETEIGLQSSNSKTPQVSLKLNTSQWFGPSLPQLMVKLQRLKQGWQADLDSPSFAGKVNIADDPKEGIQARLQRFYLNPTAVSTIKQGALPSELPAIDLKIDNFKYNKMSLGRLELAGAPQNNTWQIQRLRLVTTTYELVSNGEWRQLVDKTGTQTALRGSLETRDFSGVLAALNLPPSMQSQSGSIQFDLNWNGEPYAVTPDKLKGQLSFKLRRGVITQISSEAEKKLGLGKLINLLSIETLARGLTSGFSNLSQKGFNFDIFSGSFNFSNGLAHTEDVRIDGANVSANMQGDINILKRRFQLILKVYPELTSSLPVVATIAGGPIIGAAAWVANKVIGHSMSKAISNYTYKVTGTWENPIVEQLNVSRGNDSTRVARR